MRDSRTNSTLVARSVFCPTYTPPGKTDSHFIPPCAAELYEVFRQADTGSQMTAGAFLYTGGLRRHRTIRRLLILESVKKLEELFIAPTARQILHETAQRAFARCECT